MIASNRLTIKLPKIIIESNSGYGKVDAYEEHPL
jgi:hypothetical protein